MCSQHKVKVLREFVKSSTVGVELLYSRITPENFQGSLLGNIAIVHGHIEHSVKYNTLAIRLAQKGYEAHLIDLRGHGRSGGAQYTFPNYQVLHEDIKVLLSKTNPDLPLYLFGHSMGGGLIINFL